MIHILTVHWKDDRWIDIQLQYLSQHIKEPFRVYAFLNDIPEHHQPKFFYTSTEPIASHPVKLNLLAEIAALSCDDEQDLLMFIDGDAFPIGDVMASVLEKLKIYPLVAVQRKENNGDIQPHPCFCVTTVGFWKSIKGDWKRGYVWKNAQGNPVADVGGNLLGILREKNIEWHPMLRSNEKDLHPLFYGIYENLIYHHGAGFREAACRIDKITGLTPTERAVFRLQNKLSRERLIGKIFYKLYDPTRRLNLQNQLLSEQVFEKIQTNPLFYQEFSSGA